jgi:hypothetical protein
LKKNKFLSFLKAGRTTLKEKQMDKTPSFGLASDAHKLAIKDHYTKLVSNGSPQPFSSNESFPFQTKKTLRAELVNYEPDQSCSLASQATKRVPQTNIRKWVEMQEIPFNQMSYLDL